jgi:hypothetical protein
MLIVFLLCQLFPFTFSFSVRSPCAVFSLPLFDLSLGSPGLHFGMLEGLSHEIEMSYKRHEGKSLILK